MKPHELHRMQIQGEEWQGTGATLQFHCCRTIRPRSSLLSPCQPKIFRGSNQVLEQVQSRYQT